MAKWDCRESLAIKYERNGVTCKDLDQHHLQKSFRGIGMKEEREEVDEGEHGDGMDIE